MNMIIFLLFFLVPAHAQTYQYVKECLDSANPYTSFNTVPNLLENVDVCLSRAYISFPGQFREEFSLRIEACIDSIRETDRSKPEYHALQKEVAQLTSNTGESIIETGHVISQLSVCTASLKIVTSIDVYEEARFDSIADHFVHQLADTDACIEDSVRHINEHVIAVDEKLAEYKSKYEKWVNMTSIRQNAAEECHSQLGDYIEMVSRNILREWNGPN
jgi:hypothetical protein